ncbi:MAG: PIN domain-containing protein [Lachnospiraceae bacterium]|nr:PIN domain-containing protein [Lachnospiraceae bacterium]
MSTYLIDFENVKSGGLAGINHIGKEDSVHLFWSARENKISIEMMEMIRSSESEIVMHKAVTGERDALDHQLCSYLGFLAGAKGEKSFVIVSNDKAYDHLIEFWRRMNDTIHIQRVSEISRVSELPSEEMKVSAVVLPVEEAAPAGQAVSGEKTAYGEKTVSAERPVPAETEASEAETAAFEVRGGRNYRRRERSGKYLKGGRAGRGSRRNIFMEERAEDTRTAEQVRESEGTAAYAAAQPAVEVSPAAYVVTGIKTVLVESGFTADGILDNRNNSQQTEEIPAGKSEDPDVSDKKTEVKKEEKKPEKSDDAWNEQGKNSQNPKKPDEAEKKPEPEIKPEKKSENAPEEQAETTTENTPAGQAESEPDKRPAKTEPEQKTEDQAEPEKKSEIQTETESGQNQDNESGKENAEAVKEEASEEQEKKTRTRSARPAGRKRGRPPKKEHADNFPEIKIPVIESDVIAKCEEAANAEWTGEVVRLINQSRDKKELYSAIVKLLGQEKGRTVYHAIKVLK